MYNQPSALTAHRIVIITFKAALWIFNNADTRCLLLTGRKAISCQFVTFDST